MIKQAKKAGRLRFSKGFSLLEVLFALLIAALALGTVMGLSGSSKRLALRAQIGLERVVYERAALNAAQVQLKPKYPEHPEKYAKDFDVKRNDALERPERQTKKILFVLEPYTIQGKDGQDSGLQGLRWKRLKSLPQ